MRTSWIKDMLMINDGEKEVGIAGIMGGENSKITDDVKTMLFESGLLRRNQYPPFCQASRPSYRCIRKV